jgi:predicted amidophosphoribosyltransferase
VRALPVLRSLGRAVLDLLAPPACLACGRVRAGRLGLCALCETLIRPLPPRPCPRCAAPLGPAAPVEACHACAELRPRFAATVAGGAYPGLLGELVRRAKYGADPVLAVPLGRLLAAEASAVLALAGVDAVTPAPASRSRTRERGFHLADLVADPVARALDAPQRPGWLRRVGDPPPQASLPRSERRRAARGTVEVPPRALRHVVGARVLVVDDVMTTGATADACARALLEAGAAQVLVAVAARA